MLLGARQLLHEAGDIRLIHGPVAVHVRIAQSTTVALVADGDRPHKCVHVANRHPSIAVHIAGGCRWKSVLCYIGLQLIPRC